MRGPLTVRSAEGSVVDNTDVRRGNPVHKYRVKRIKYGQQSRYRTQAVHVSDNRAVAFGMCVVSTRFCIGKYIRPWVYPRRHN
jgi:hypothetical protein